MGRKKGYTKKDPYSGLPEGFKEAIEGMSRDEIRKRISDIAILDCEYRAALATDPAVQDAKRTLKNLMEPYRDDFKSCKLQLAYCKQALDDKGGATVSSAVEGLQKAIGPNGKMTVSAGGKSATIAGK
jgi:hypothetical protein